AHIPLIHGPDGAKLSKRHGALGIAAYRDMGFLPEALRNYLLRLGWSHGDDEIISTEQAIAWFDLPAIGRGPARFDMAKLTSLNGHYMRMSDDDDLAARVRPFLERALDRPIDDAETARLRQAMPGLKERAKTLAELAQNAVFYFLKRPLVLDKKLTALMDDAARHHLAALVALLQEAPNWDAASLEALVRDYAARAGLGLGKIAQPLRAALTASSTSPGIFDVMAVLGRAESVGRLQDQLANADATPNIGRHRPDSAVKTAT
ncbi:MAG: glutamate--tRNA ligase, partial [Alphaproteobacteria bacterium]